MNKKYITQIKFTIIWQLCIKPYMNRQTWNRLVCLGVIKKIIVLVLLLSGVGCSMKAPPQVVPNSEVQNQEKVKNPEGETPTPTPTGAPDETTDESPAPSTTPATEATESPTPSKPSEPAEPETEKAPAITLELKGSLAEQLFGALKIKAANQKKSGEHFECSAKTETEAAQCKFLFRDDGTAIAPKNPGEKVEQSELTVGESDNYKDENEDLNLQLKNFYGRINFRGELAKKAFDAIQLNALEIEKDKFFYPGQRKKGAQVDCYKSTKEGQTDLFQCTVHLEWNKGALQTIL